MKKLHVVISLFYAYCFVFAIILSCDSDDIHLNNLYTFTGETVGEYLENRPKLYSEFTRLLDTTNIMGLLKAYGKYTCFAPDNEAMFRFYREKGKRSLEDFTVDTLKKIGYDHIIKDVKTTSEFFVEGRLADLSMSGRHISITYASYREGEKVIKVNKSSQILQLNIEVHNGVIHTLGKVLDPTELNIVEALAADSKFSLFYNALVATGLDKKLLLVKDESFDPNKLVSGEEFTIYGVRIKNPKERKYGFTILAESDSTYATNNIKNLDDMANYAKQIYDRVYPGSEAITDYTHPKNSLNRFVAYHLLDRQLSFSQFIIDLYNTGHAVQTYDMFEFIETMCPNTLLEVRTNVSTSETNLFNMTGAPETAIRIVSDNYDNDAINGVYHEIDKILIYNLDVLNMLSTKRLRMDVAGFFSELANNNLRRKSLTEPTSELWQFPKGYFENLKVSETTIFGYNSPDDRFPFFQGDAFWLEGLFEFSIRTPPIPAGTYEVRYAYQAYANRGVAQVYWDSVPCGIPLDFSILASDPRIGYETPGSNPSDPYGYENDKMMRSRGYMKGPASVIPANTDWFDITSRYNPRNLRRILGIYHFEKMKPHTFSIKSFYQGSFNLDFLEFVPIEVLEYEDIY